jgi:hypothetical protein|tara:strand:+ start:254 stop:493 length:240 start_codon:yes stop_codon:yes gene_type:complete
MVNKKVLSDLGARMDLDTREKSAQVTEPSGEKIEAAIPQEMGKAVKRYGVKSRVAEDHLGDRTRGGVSLENRSNIAPDD